MVVRNTCLDELKKKKPIYFESTETVPHLTEAETYNENKEAVELVKKIIDTLPDSQREVIQMRDIDELDFDEIAKILDTDIAYIRVLLSRARKAVKAKLIKIYAYEAIGK